MLHSGKIFPRLKWQFSINGRQEFLIGISFTVFVFSRRRGQNLAVYFRQVQCFTKFPGTDLK